MSRVSDLCGGSACGVFVLCVGLGGAGHALAAPNAGSQAVQKATSRPSPRRIAPTSRAVVQPASRPTQPPPKARGAAKPSPSRSAVKKAPGQRAAVKRPKAPKKPGVGFWMDKLKQHHWRARYDATQGLAKIGWKAMGAKAGLVKKALLWRLGKDENFWVRQGAARALGRMGKYGVLALAKAVLDDAKAEVRNEAARALGAIAQRGHQPLLEGHQVKVLAALRKARKDKAIRWTAAQTWEHITGDPQPLVDVMTHDLLTRRGRLRGIVALAFGRLSTRAKAIAAMALLDLAARPSSTQAIQRYIVDALHAIGKVALPALRRAQKHKQPAVRGVARQAIQRIGQATP